MFELVWQALQAASEELLTQAAMRGLDFDFARPTDPLLQAGLPASPRRRLLQALKVARRRKGKSEVLLVSGQGLASADEPEPGPRWRLVVSCSIMRASDLAGASCLVSPIDSQQWGRLGPEAQRFSLAFVS